MLDHKISNTNRTRIVDTNARYLGVEISDLMEKAGEGIARELLKKYGADASYAFLCGLGNNGGNGLAAARHLHKLGLNGQITVYLVGRRQHINAEAAKHHWAKIQKYIKQHKPDDLTVLQDAYAKVINSHDVIVECLVGTGIHGKLKKKFRDVITRAYHFRQKMVSIDVPVPGYNWDLSLSIMYPKTPDAKVIDIGMPAAAEYHAGPGHVQALFSPRNDSYKSQNGSLLLIGHPGEFLNGLVSSATFYTGKIYIYTDSNDDLTDIKSIASPLAEILIVDKDELEEVIDKADAIYIGAGIPKNIINNSLCDHLLRSYKNKKFIFDNYSSKLLDINLLKELHEVLIITDRQNLAELLADQDDKSSNVQGKLKRFCAEHKIYVCLTGTTDLIFGVNPFNDRCEMWMNRRHANTPDYQLPGLTAAFATKNDIWLATISAAFLSGITEDTKNLKDNWDKVIEF